MSQKGKTTISLEPEVAKALKHYMADAECSFRDQSRVINDLLMKGLTVAKNEIGEQADTCPA